MEAAMEQTKNRLFLLVPLCFAVLTLSCWIRSPKSESLAERRKLAQMPAFSVNAKAAGFPRILNATVRISFPCGKPSAP